MTALADSAVATTFDTLNPATGAVLATFPVATDEDVRAAVAQARDAAEGWGALTFAQRKKHLLAWKRVMDRRRGEILALLAAENGKVAADALVELTLTLHHLDWAARHAGRVLATRRTSPGLLMLNQAAEVSYRPYGVVGVIGPWNYPVFTPMGSIAYALAAGNAVVFKPSEHTPAIGSWLADTFAEAVPGHPVLTVVTGFGQTGAALCQAGVDKLAFTGSAPTGRKIMAACAQSLTPVLMELGGKDALIVGPGADVAKAARAAVWGGFTNAGQTCAGVERVYVVEAVYEKFLAAVTAQASALRAGRDYGPITMPKQVEVIARHIDAALDGGGRAVVGGRESVRAPFVDPVVLVEVPADNAAVREETFGPVLVVTRVADLDEAVALTNNSDYRLGASVFDGKGAAATAARLRTGMVAVNDVLSFPAVGALPFGGSGGSGFGRIHGEEGLREFAWPRSTARRRFASPVVVNSYRTRAWDLPAFRLVGRLVGAL